MAYIAILAGIGLGYLELVRPGWILPGATGASLLMLGVASLASMEIDPLGLVWLISGVALVLADAWFGWHGLTAAAGFAVASIGARQLVTARLDWMIAAPPTIILLTLTWWLARTALRAYAAKAAI